MSSSELKQKRLCSIEKFPNLKEFSEFLNSLNKAEVKHFTKMILEVLLYIQQCCKRFTGRIFRKNSIVERSRFVRRFGHYLKESLNIKISEIQILNPGFVRQICISKSIRSLMLEIERGGQRSRAARGRCQVFN